MRVFRVLLYDEAEVLDCLLVVLDHLVGLGSFVQVADVARDHLDALKKGKEGLTLL